MTQSKSFREQAQNLETLARRAPMGAQRILLSSEAKTLYEAAERAERAEEADPPAA